VAPAREEPRDRAERRRRCAAVLVFGAGLGRAQQGLGALRPDGDRQMDPPPLGFVRLAQEAQRTVDARDQLGEGVPRQPAVPAAELRLPWYSWRLRTSVRPRTRSTIPSA